MNSSRPPHRWNAREYGSWIGFWGQFVLLALLAIYGAFVAGAAAEPGDDSAGLWLSLAAVGLAFLRLKQYFDAGRTDWQSFLLVEDMRNLIAVIVVFAVLGLAGLWVAARSQDGSLHNAGIALFVASALAVLLSLKRVFDKAEGRH